MSQRFDAVLKAQGGVPEAAATERRASSGPVCMLRYRNQTIGVAIAFSLMPFAFGFMPDDRLDPAPRRAGRRSGLAAHRHRHAG